MLLSGIKFKKYYVSKLLTDIKEELTYLNIPFELGTIKTLVNYIDNNIPIPNDELVKVLNCVDYLLIDNDIFIKIIYQLILSINNYKELINIMFLNVCRSGSRELVELMIRQGADDWNEGLHWACKGGHKEIVELLIEKGADGWNWGLYGACRGGHKELVEFFIEKGADNWNFGLHGACEGGHKEIVELLIKKGASNKNSFVAVKSKHYFKKFFTKKLEQKKYKALNCSIKQYLIRIIF